MEDGIREMKNSIDQGQAFCVIQSAMPKENSRQGSYMIQLIV